VFELLRRHRAETWMRGNNVSVIQEGRPIEITILRRCIWSPAVRWAGMRNRMMYQFCHTDATLMLATGENLEWIAKQLGHTSIQMLFQRYAKFVPNVIHRDGTAFVQAYQGWFNGQVSGRVEMGPLDTLYNTSTPPQQKRG
jgi:integrase